MRYEDTGIMSKLIGKVALVTGASKGIGASIAKELAANGAAVAVNYSSSPEAAKKVVAQIEAAGGKAIAVQANVADPDSIGSLITKVSKDLGPIDILVNNAGIYEFGALEAITPDHFHKQFNLNVLGLLLTTQAVVAQLPKTGGSIINIGSVVGAMAAPQAAVYSATKGAVDTITVSLSKELGSRGIRVNALNPGLVVTEGSRAAGIAGGDFEANSVAGTPLGRVGQPRDIATVAAFLASDDAAWLTGQTIYASGGFRM
jgi:3-oxoacyl-[acyl-carrier protein] reductase